MQIRTSGITDTFSVQIFVWHKQPQTSAMTYCSCAPVLFGTSEERDDCLCVMDVLGLHKHKHFHIQSYFISPISRKCIFNKIFIISIPMIKVMLLLMFLTWVVVTWVFTLGSLIKHHLCVLCNSVYKSATKRTKCNKCLLQEIGKEG